MARVGLMVQEHCSNVVKKEQLKSRGQKIQNVVEVVAILEVESNKYHVAHPETMNHINKSFHLIKVGDVDQSKTFECETMKGSQKLHQVIRFVSNRELVNCCVMKKHLLKKWLPMKKLR